LWGTTWTVADINAGNFGAAIAAAAGNNNGVPTVTVNSMTITVNYTVPLAAAGGFNAYETSTAAGAITGVIKTKIAGSTISVDMIALNAAKTAIATTFTGTVRVEVLNASDNSGALDGNSCRPTWTVIQTLSPDPAFVVGDNGRKTISFTQPNSFPEARLRITYPAGAPTVTGCSTDNFAIRPNTFASFAVTDTDWQTTGTPGARALNLLTFAATTPIHKAGRPLSVRATAVNAAGTPATTTNYTGAPTATLTACVGAACTATFGTLTLTTTFVAGQLASDVASYDNVGSFRLELVDSSFAIVDAGDSSALEREIRSGTLDVGRFVPDHFAVALNAPVFGTACGAGSFTYIGQAFNYTTAPVITVTAQGFANNTTTLYATSGSWWRITNASLTGWSYTAASGTLDTSGITGTDPAIADTGSGVGTLTFRTPSFFVSGTGFFFSRTTPVAPFNADVSLALNVIDADGVAYAGNPARFSQATAGNGMAFNNSKEMRFGRLRLTNAFGSTLLDLPLSLSTQYYDGNFFVTNALDSCTTLLGSDLRFGFLGATPNLVACETAINPGGTIFFVGGKASATASPTLTPAKLAKPGSGNDGAVDITINLNGIAGNRCTAVGVAGPAATNANKPWLQGNWSGGTYTVDPTGRATFGIFKNADQFLYFREVY
jgi:MSHA biogenesis protein MshQ